MTEATTSLARDLPHVPATAPAPGEVIGALRAFLRRPRLPERVTGFSGAALAGLARLYLLDLAVMGGLLGLAALAMSGGFKLPDNQINSLTLDAKTLALIVLFAPLIEELIFRSWLSGRPGHVLALLLGAGGLLALAATAALGGAGTPEALKGLAIAAVCLVAAIAALVLLRRRAAPRWFARAFPVFFYLATIGFALMHILNYTEGAAPLLVLLVIPQAVIGAILGFVRVTYGMWANVLLHVVHNGTFIGLVLLAGEVGGKA